MVVGVMTVMSTLQVYEDEQAMSIKEAIILLKYNLNLRIIPDDNG